MSEFFSIITNTGLQKLAALPTGETLTLTHMAFGNSTLEPTADMTSLHSEQYRCELTKVQVDKTNKNNLVTEATIEADVGGFWVREIGIYDEFGDLFAVGKYPATYKPLDSEGTVKELGVRMILRVSNADSVIVTYFRGIIDGAANTDLDNLTFAGQSMAKLSNVLQMPISEMSKVGDVINHLSNNIAATAPEITEVNLRAGAMAKTFGLSYNEVSALAGTFVSMGKSPEIAGTAINMMASRLKLIPVSSGAAREAFDQLGISMAEYTEMIESGRGKDALLAVLDALTKIQGVKRSQIMVDMFGENANRHINSLVESLDTLKANFELVANETEYAGSMQREFAARSATTENNLQLLKNQMAVLATNIGATLLPAINSVVGIFGQAASSLAEFAEKHPTLIKYIGLAVAGMTSFKLASFALGYGFTFLKGGALAIVGVFSKVKTIFSVAKIALGAVIPVIKAVGTAFLTNPVGLIITGIAVGAALIIKYWKPISAFFKRLFEPVIQVFKQVWNWITGLWEKAKDIFNGVKDWLKDSWVGKAWNWAFGDDDEETEKPPKIGDTVSVINEMSNAAAPVELPQSKISSSNSSSVAISAPITINAAAGMSAEDIAVAVQTELNNRENEATRRTRGANFD